MELLTPGNYLQHIPGERSIEGISTATAGFAGVTQKGPILKPGFVTSWKQFNEIYGGFMAESYLAYAVKGFFDNVGDGGGRAYISRVVGIADGEVKSKPSTVEIKAGEEVVALVNAKEHGTFYDGYVVNLSKNEDEELVFSIKDKKGEAVEEFTIKSLETIEEEVTNTSKVVELVVIEDDKVPEEFNVTLAGADNGITDLQPSDFVGSEELGNGLHAFDKVEVNLVSVPGMTDATTLKGIENYMNFRGDASAIISAPKGLVKVNEIKEYFQKTAKLASSRLFPYDMWGTVIDPIGVGKDPKKMIDLAGHVLGMFVRITNTRGVHKTPAGTEATLFGVLDLEYHLTDGEQAILNPVGINSIRAFDGEGIVVWGGRTLSSDPEYKYISVRRTVDFVGQSILKGTRWAVFEPNNSKLWTQVRVTAESFLRGFWRNDGLKGESESQAFVVVCDDTTTTPDDIDLGRLYCDVAISPQKPAEFVVFRLSLMK